MYRYTPSRKGLGCGEQVNSVSMESSGETPLILASRFNDEDVVEFLVERGASLEMRDSRGCTAFHHVAEGGKLRNMLRLIELGADVLKLNLPRIFSISFGCCKWWHRGAPSAN